MPAREVDAAGSPRHPARVVARHPAPDLRRGVEHTLDVNEPRCHEDDQDRKCAPDRDDPETLRLRRWGKRANFTDHQERNGDSCQQDNHGILPLPCGTIAQYDKSVDHGSHETCKSLTCSERQQARVIIGA